MITELNAVDAPQELERRPPAAARSPRPQAPRAEAWIDGFQLYRFPLALAVVTVHSGQFALAHAAPTGPGTGGAGLGRWLVDFLVLISLPATSSFLAMAGFLFFRNGPITQNEYRGKLRSRLYTLLLPYLAWNFLAIILLCAPGALKYFFYGFESHPWFPLSLSSLVSSFVGWPVYPADSPLWFLRDLMLLSVAAPLLLQLPGRAQVLALGLLGLYWLRGPIDLIPGGIPRAFSTFFFLAGAWMGLNRISPANYPIPGRVLVIAAAVLVLSAALGATLSVTGGDHAATGSFFEKAARISGTVLVMGATTRVALAGSFSGLLRRLSNASFFLFGSHYCVLICFSVIIAHLRTRDVGLHSEPFLFAAFWSVAFGISMGVYFLLKRHAPSALWVLDGGRTRSAEAPRVAKPHRPSQVPLAGRPTPALS